MEELFGGHQQASNEFGITRYNNNNNNKPSLKSFKKLSKPRSTRQLAIASFNYSPRSVLNGRTRRRRRGRRTLQNWPRNNTGSSSTTPKSLYNCPKRVSARLHNLISQLQSVKSVVVLLQLWWEPQGLHQLLHRVVAVFAQ